MAYKHILVAVDLSPESNVLVQKAVSMAKPYNAKVSLIHVDVNYSDLYTAAASVPKPLGKCSTGYNPLRT